MIAVFRMDGEMKHWPWMSCGGFNLPLCITPRHQSCNGGNEERQRCYGSWVKNYPCGFNCPSLTQSLIALHILLVYALSLVDIIFLYVEIEIPSLNPMPISTYSCFPINFHQLQREGPHGKCFLDSEIPSPVLVVWTGLDVPAKTCQPSAVLATRLSMMYTLLPYR